jgi:multidrug efflux pump subunit AcrB
MIKKIIIAVVIIAAIGFGVYKYSMRAVPDVTNEAAKFTTSFADVNTKMNNTDTTALQQYTNQIITVSGIVSNIQKSDSSITISVGDSSNMNTIECQIDNRHQQDFETMTIMQPVNIKGVCAGYNMDDMGLGSSLQLKNCVLGK